MLLYGENITVKNGSRILFENITLSVEAGSSVAIVGSSGSGKTTLLNCLGLIRKPSKGQIVIDGFDYSSYNKRDVLRFWRFKAAFIYQNSGVIDDKSVIYNVTLNHYLTKKNAMLASRALNRVGLEERGADKAVVLSGGEKQRLGVARAIYKNACIIFADEPTASLDELNREHIFNLLQDQTKMGKSIVVATHDLEFARSCDSIIDLDNHVYK